jgi:hypothetical protein
MNELPTPGDGIDYSDPGCELSAAEVLAITSAENIVLGEYVRWCSLDTDGDDS